MYGVKVNSSPSDFSQFLGVYVTPFFVVAQIINFAVFGTRRRLLILADGILIVAGVLRMTFWRTQFSIL